MTNQNKKAFKMAIEALEEEARRLAVNANLHEMHGLDSPGCINASLKRKEIRAAIKTLTEFMEKN